MTEPTNHTVCWELKRADSRTFSGSAFSGLLAGADAEVPVKLYFVRFAPGARTFWHTHSGPQILIIQSGVCRYQRAGGPLLEAVAGESIRFKAGERHWHGATPTEGAEHIAVNLTVGETEWQEEVSEEDYTGRGRAEGGSEDATAALFSSAPPA
jgi:quercetin dioxygenase-like cupin family protein